MSLNSPTAANISHPTPADLALRSPVSGIVDVITYGRDREGLIPLWVGEGDLATPDFITKAAADSLAQGETFYTWQRGIPELRQAMADYMSRLSGVKLDAERFFVTGSGMQAIRLAVQIVADPGQSIIVPSPAWPNIVATADLQGVNVREIDMPFINNRFTLDLVAIEEAAKDPKTRAIFVNSPSNPTGWVADLTTLKAIHDLAEKHDIWIIADEIYSRFVYGDAALAGSNPRRAPSFRDVAPDSPRVLYVNTMSKNWAMTGWRVGWLEAPVRHGQMIENLIQYSTSGVAAFMQRAACAALEKGDDFIAMQVERATRNRDVLVEAFAPLNRLQASSPDGAFYLFFRVEGQSDTSKLARKMVDDIAVGVAPGTAFGPGGHEFLRLCFARDPEHVAEVASRIATWVSTSA